MTSPSEEDLNGRSQQRAGLQLLAIALSATVLFHGGLLPFTHGNTYDAFIHMFFGDHYHRNWFDPWEPRWYTGFATTSYPPGTHMAIGALMYLMRLRLAFAIVQLCGLILLVIGVYRFALLWVSARAAGYAAIALVLASSISETVHLFGQLPTICSLGIFLNGLPYVYRWIVLGGWKSFGASVIFVSATTAAHHVTTIFGGVLFILPIGLHALRTVAIGNPVRQWFERKTLTRFVAPLLRGGLLAVFMAGAIVLIVFPYWYWSVSDPITQVSIPHGSRESFLVRTDLGFMFFLLPWGITLLFLPYVVYKTVTTAAWPLGISVILCFILGTGGTTPIPRFLLRGAFDILTLDRFTFWATILVLPFIGLMLDGLIHGRSGNTIRAALGRGAHRLIVGGIFLSMVIIAVFAATLPALQQTQPKFIDPTPIVQFLGEDEHDRWRYLTLGFGDQFAYLSAQTEAQSVDGNYHSARRLPDMTRFSVERLENAKYLGVPGLGSLQQFLVNAETYHLKYVFSNDAFYDPLLHFSGWTRLNRLDNGVVVWEKPDISPLPLVQPRLEIPRFHALMWGVLPPVALILAAAVFLGSVVQRNFGTRLNEYRPVIEPQDGFSNPRRVRILVIVLALAALAAAAFVSVLTVRRVNEPLNAEQVIERYFKHLDFRRYREAYALLDPQTRPTFDAIMFGWRWRGGLLSSYGKLEAIQIEPVQQSDHFADWELHLDWLTSLSLLTEEKNVRTVERDGQWFIVPMELRPVQSPLRLLRDPVVDWNVAGRRQPRAETNLHRDRLDRPRIAVDGARLVRRNGRYAVVGLIANTDADPASISIFSSLKGQGEDLAMRAAGQVNGSRLLPGESAGFRIDFEGVLSLTNAEATKQFDPTRFIPPEFSHPPDAAAIEARALVNGRDLYRGIALNAVRTSLENGVLHVSGQAVNTGTETATIVSVNALLYDLDNRPVWADVGFVETNIYPGQSAPFSLELPLRDEIDVIASIESDQITTNGSGMQSSSSFQAAGLGTLPLPPATGYGAIRLNLSTMTYDPLF